MTYVLFNFKMEGPGQSYSPIKTKLKLSSIKKKKKGSVLNVWDPTHGSLARQSMLHVACPLGSGWLHSTATIVLAGIQLTWHLPSVWVSSVTGLHVLGALQEL